MMARCPRVVEHCFGDVLRAHAVSADAAHLAPMLCAGSVLVLQDQQYDAALALLASLGYASKSFALVHISHSFIYRDEAPLHTVAYRYFR